MTHRGRQCHHAPLDLAADEVGHHRTDDPHRVSELFEQALRIAGERLCSRESLTAAARLLVDYLCKRADEKP